MKALILPPLRRTVWDAVPFARAVHAGQLDKAGNPYDQHVERVASRVQAMMCRRPQFTERQVDEALQIAWLHDVIEDTPYTSDDILDEGFHRNVVAAVRLLSKPPGCLRYLDWVTHITMIADLPTILVKLADNEDNADPERLARLPEATRTRLLAKYEPSMTLLREAAREKGWQR